MEKIEEKITERTCAILPVHVYGNICNVEDIEWIARKYNLAVIYDAAHAFGENTRDKVLGNLGMYLVLASMQLRFLILSKVVQYAIKI